MSNSAKLSQQQVHWSFWLGVSFFVLVIVGLISFSWFVSIRVGADESSPVTSLVISGDMPYTQVVEIEHAIEAINLSNFFNVDVNEVHHVVKTLPWVYSVAVRKQWPNELKIHVVDQKPVAIWNGDFLINDSGVAFQADQSRLFSQLPAFFGPEGSEITALDNYRNLNKLLQFSQLAIDELVLSERFAWQLTLTDGVTLNLGRENRIERVQRFMDVYPKIIENKKADQQVSYVDLRYDTGLAVGWKALAPTADNKKNIEKRA
ncbi:MAG: cell division protein FtsQ/DivIB [Thalassotalea sp.]